MTDPIVYLNGSYVEMKNARVSVEDRGFQFGDGVYEGVRIYNRTPFRLDAHLKRLRRSAEALEIPWPEDDLEAVSRELARGAPEAGAFLYLQITRGLQPRTHHWSEAPPTVVAYARPIPPIDRSGGWSAITREDTRWSNCWIKTINLLPNVLARQVAFRTGSREAIFVRNGLITEGAASNVFIVLDGTLFTHPADGTILQGISRDIVIELAEGGVREDALSLDRARSAQEMFLTGTTTEVAPLVELDGRPVGSGKPGPFAERLAKAYEALWRRECASS